MNSPGTTASLAPNLSSGAPLLPNSPESPIPTNRFSFIAECDHRIDSRRPPRGNATGSECDAHEHEQNGTNREWIERAHIEKLAHQNTSESQGNNQSRKQA